MREHGIKFLKAASLHHESLAREHRALAELHQFHSEHHDGEGELVKAAHCRQVGVRHAAIAKVHNDRSEALDEMRQLIEGEDGSEKVARGREEFLAKTFGT
jgi:hypothetical protein